MMEESQKRGLTRREFVRDTAKISAAAAVGFKVLNGSEVSAGTRSEIKKTRSYSPEMEYRRLGKTGLWISAVAMGGHWKRVDKILGYSPKKTDPGFLQNRTDVVDRCLEKGINLIDFAGGSEPDVYATALKGRRDQMYLAWEETNRPPDHRTAKQLLEALDGHLKRTGLEYADIWRIMCLERGGRHTQQDVEEMIKALDTAKKQGKCRFTGFSTHDRKWAKMLMEKYPDQIEVVLFPYMAKSKVAPTDSFFDAIKKNDVGILGIKPFSSNSLFKGDGSPDSPYVVEDNKRARMAIRHVLANPAITAPIPGLASPDHVDNVALAIKEYREQDLDEKKELALAADEMWNKLPANYQWLKNWEYV
jgi:predicted aldo/keto reductase-like oxidoreductase